MDSEIASALLFECGICIENKPIECINFLPCIHFICTACHDKLIKNECPFCRNVISPEKEQDSFDEYENEYNDTMFEMLVIEGEHRTRRTNKSRKRFKKQERRIMKLMNNNKEVYVTVNDNTFRVLSNIQDP